MAVRKVDNQKQKEGLIFAHTYDLSLPPVAQIQAKHWRSMIQRNNYLAEVFERPPVTVYRRQPNIRNYLVRAKLPNSSKERDR